MSVFNAIDLSTLAASVPFKRKLVDAGDPTACPPVPPTYESNGDFRKCVVFAPESFSTAGADGANIIPDLVAESRLVLHPYWH